MLRTLVDLGYIRQESSRQYVLGPRLIRLGDASSRMLSVWARPHLARLVDDLGESANLAMLDGDEIVYIAQAQGPRFFPTVNLIVRVDRDPLGYAAAVQRTGIVGVVT